MEGGVLLTIVLHLSSAIQIVPQLQKVSGAELSCFIRSRTWISPPFGQRVAEEYKLGDGMVISKEQIAEFEADPKAWFEFRTKIEADASKLEIVHRSCVFMWLILFVRQYPCINVKGHWNAKSSAGNV